MLYLSYTPIATLGVPPQSCIKVPRLIQCYIQYSITETWCKACKQAYDRLGWLTLAARFVHHDKTLTYDQFLTVRCTVMF